MDKLETKYYLNSFDKHHIRGLSEGYLYTRNRDSKLRRNERIFRELLISERLREFMQGPKLTPEQNKEIRQIYNNTFSISAIANKWGISKPRVCQIRDISYYSEIENKYYEISLLDMLVSRNKQLYHMVEEIGEL